MWILQIDSMLQCVCLLVDHSWRQSVVRTKKWRSEPCGLDVTISASCNWSIAIFTASLESRESYLTLRNLPLDHSRFFPPAHSVLSHGSIMLTASPASRCRSAGSLATRKSRSRSRNFNVKNAASRGVCTGILFRPLGCPLLVEDWKKLTLVNLLLMDLISDRIFSNFFSLRKLMSMPLQYQSRYESRLRTEEWLIQTLLTKTAEETIPFGAPHTHIPHIRE